MKRSIILLLVLLPIVAFSQMQNIISQGNKQQHKGKLHMVTILLLILI